jgi:hypothetical protein
LAPVPDCRFRPVEQEVKALVDVALKKRGVAKQVVPEEVVVE